MTSAGPDLARLLHDAEQSSWQLAAVATALRGSDDEELTIAAWRVLNAVGLDEAGLRSSGSSMERVVAQASAPLLQTAALVSGAPSWTEQTDEALVAQGRTSAQGAGAFAALILPMLGDLASRLAKPHARILDVGTGVGALAVAYAEAFPAAHVVGIDVSERALTLAAQTLESSPAGGRVELRQVGIAELEDEAGFDLAWVPAPFIPERALRPGLSRVAAALRPGGWLMLAHGRYGADVRDDAINRFKTIVFGGTPLDDAAAEQLLADVDLASVRHIPTPAGAPALAVANKV